MKIIEDKVLCQNPLVSVYCKVYNQEKYVKTCIESVVNQKTNFDYEIIVHDDCSTDGTRQILQDYQKKYPQKIKLLLQDENQFSQNVNMNVKYIFPEARGKYIASCEGDDYWLDMCKLQKQVDFLENNQEYVACVHNSRRLNLHSGEEDIMYQQNGDYDIQFVDVIQGGGCCYQSASLMRRRETIYNLPSFFDIVSFYGDYTTAIYLTTLGKVRFLDQVMSVYRLFADGSLVLQSEKIDKKKKIDRYEKTCKMLQAVDDYTEKKYEQEIQNVIRRNKYMIEEYSGNYNKLSKEPYRAIYMEHEWKYRVKVFLKGHMMGVYLLYQKIRYGKDK